jgi:hypothetical protein
MIIGAIIETTWTPSGAQTSSSNGASMMNFYTIDDAIQWAEIQSEVVYFGTNPEPIIALCTVIDTDTGVKRWWFNGVEYTG